MSSVLISRSVFASLFAVALAGCGGLEGEIKGPLDKSLSNVPLCLDLGMPPYMAYSTENDWKYALREEGLMASMPASGGTFEMIPSKKGEKLIKNNKLCYGHTKFVKIVDVSKPVDTALGKMVTVEARVKHVVDAKWAKNPEIAPQTRQGEETVTVNLLKKKSGWERP